MEISFFPYLDWSSTYYISWESKHWCI